MKDLIQLFKPSKPAKAPEPKPAPAPKPKPSLLQRDDMAEAQSTTQKNFAEQAAQKRRDENPNPGMHPDRALGLGFKGEAPVTPFFRPGVWDEKVTPGAPIKAADDRNGDARVQMGELDPDAQAKESQKYRADEVAPGVDSETPSGAKDRIGSAMLASAAPILPGATAIPEIMEIAGDPDHWKNPDVGHLAKHAVAPTLKSLMQIRDINGRLAQSRRWAVDDPADDTDDPVIQYTTPENNTYTTTPTKDSPTGQLQDYFDIGDGKPRTMDEMRWDVDYSSASPLDAMKEVAAKDMEPGGNYVQTKDKKIWAVPNGYSGGAIIGPDGRLFATPDKYDPDEIVYDEKGQAYFAQNAKLSDKDGTVLPLKDVRGKVPTLLYRGFPDGTQVRDAAGNPTEYGRNANSRQLGGGFMNMGIRDPRAPWQDTTGKNAWEDGYDKEKNAWKEIAPYAADMALGSAPYFVPGYGLAAGAADALPYMLGYDGDSYNPTGIGLQNLDRLGEGSFAESDMTRSQQFAGVGSAIMNAALERVSGHAVGGVESLVPAGVKASKVGQAVGRMPAPAKALLSAAATEGPLEEGPNAFFDRAKTDTFPNYGKTQDWNTEQGKYVYRSDESPMARFGNVMGNVGEASAAGSFMGVTMGGGQMAPGLGINAAMYLRDKFGKPRPKNVTAPARFERGINRNLEIQYPKKIESPEK